MIKVYWVKFLSALLRMVLQDIEFLGFPVNRKIVARVVTGSGRVQPGIFTGVRPVRNRKFRKMTGVRPDTGRVYHRCEIKIFEISPVFHRCEIEFS